MTADDIWKNDALMAVNMKLGLPMWKFAEAVQAISAIEREECAKACENFDACDPQYIAAAIRARGEK